VSEDEYNTKCDQIRANIPFHMMTEREEIQARAAFDAAMAALRYVRLDAMGLDKPRGDYYAEPPSDASMDAVLGSLRCLQSDVTSLLNDMQDLKTLLDSWPQELPT
jgi:hypothetical protein